MKKKLISRMKKLKKEKDLSYQELALILNYNSATTVHRYMTMNLIPKNRFESIDAALTKAGY